MVLFRRAIVDLEAYAIVDDDEADDAVIVPQGAEHNVINTGKTAEQAADAAQERSVALLRGR